MTQDLYYTIQVNSLTFQVLETNDFGKKSYILLNADGKECVSVQVKIANNELYLSMVKYNKSCTMGSDMAHGTDTVAMVKGLLTFLLKKEEFAFVSFLDTSTIDCMLESDESNADANLSYSIPISLAFHNITIYGKTWYERYFGATIADSDIAEQIQASVHKMQNLVQADTQYARLQKTIQNTYTESRQFQNVLNDASLLLKKGMHTQSWMSVFADMFGSSGIISAKYGKSIACSLYYTLDAAINQLFEIPFECESLPMIISRETIASYPVIEWATNSTPTHKKSWGGKRTRRLPKYISLARYYGDRSLRRKRISCKTCK